MLKDRVIKARHAVPFAKVMSTDKDGNVKTVIVPGSDGKQYHVILRRHGGVWSGECRLDVGAAGHIPCKGNAHQYSCYHCIAAVIVAAEQASYHTQFTDTEPKARLLERLGMKAYRLQPWNNGSLVGEVVWVLVKKRKGKKHDQ